VTDYLKRILSASSKEEATKIIESQWAPLIGMARNILCEEIWDYPEVPEQEQYFFWELATECKPFVQHRTQMDFRDALTRLKVKTFIWGGRFDPVTPLQAMKEMRQLIPNSALWENAHAGHGLITEKDKCALDLAEKFMLTQLSLQELEQEAHRTDCQSPPQQRSSFSKLAVQVLKNSGVYPALFR
jgi:pimeloyl-ACP methyl ester carboxylesterase